MRYVTAVLTFFAVKLTARLHVKALCALCTVCVKLYFMLMNMTI